jgi:hypothetical protein
MANYYTVASFIFPLEKHQAEFAMGVLECIADDNLEDLQNPQKTEWSQSVDPTMLKCAKKLLTWLGEDYTDWGYLGFDVDIDSAGLWIRSDESINTENAAVFIRVILHHFNLDTSVSINASHTCSKLRLGAFGGHAAFVTKGGISWMSTHSFLDKKESAHQKKLAKKMEARL